MHRTITRRDLVEKLAKLGYPLRRVRIPEHAASAVEEATNRYLGGVRGRLIQQTLVPRTAAGTLLSRLNGTASDSVMTGSAGTGKTACVIEVVNRLREREQPVLVFRLDRVPSWSTTTDLGSHLGLQESPVLVLAAAAEAARRPGVLIVDQLDAVSTMSGRSSEAFDLVERLIQEARGMRARATIHTVVVCRAFDWKHDSRLRGLLPKEHVQVDVTEFGSDEVKELLKQTGFNPTLFKPRQLELLRLPQNLALFLEAGFDPTRAPAFHTATKLFDEYWNKKRAAVTALVGPDQWMPVVETLCNEMNATQQLSIPKERLDSIPSAYLRQLASEGVLTFDGRRYGFGHESFFDYCFARVFMNRRESMTSFLKASEQHLFRRAQVRQVLAYLREADVPRYVRELEDLLSDAEIRTHIKDLAFAMLSEVTDPKEEEWTIWNRWTAAALQAIENGTPNLDRLSGLAWRWFFGSASWFSIADGRGMIEGWLASENDQLADLAVHYLQAHHAHAPDRVAALLGPYAAAGGTWMGRLRRLMEATEHHTSRAYFDLLLQLVDNGALDDVSRSGVTNDSFWFMLHGLGENRPEWIAEVVAHRLRRRFAVISSTGEDLLRSESIGYDEAAATMIRNSAERAPVEFVEQVLPVVLEISDSSLIEEDQPPKRDKVWRTISKHGRGERVCLSALAAALKELASEHSETALEIIPEMRRRDTYVANYLLQSVYGGAAKRLADDAVSMLSDEPWRFQCGFVDSPSWCTMELIRAVIPHCAVRNRERLETAILDYVGPSERPSSQPKYNAIGRTSYSLLSAIPRELRSSRANRSFDELARRFGTPDTEPRGMVAGPVRPPIGETAAAMMTDDQWRRAIKKYHREWRAFAQADFLKGGAYQLSQVLGKHTKEEPDRFARLSLTFPADANPVYLERVLDALRDVAIEVEIKLQVCRKAFADSREQCGKSIADVLGSIDDSLPQDAVEMLHWLATEHEDPEKELWQEDAGRGQTYYNGEIHTNGINTTRGRAAEAIQRLILTDATYIERFRPTLERMIVDRSAAVRSCVAGALGDVAFHNPERGMSLFRRMDVAEDRLLATVHVDRFIHRYLHNDFPRLRPIIERMLHSAEPEVCEAGARLASIAAIMHERAADLGDEALHGNPHQRLGTAQVAARNIGVPEFRAWCEARLLLLFDDDDGEVRKETATCFGRLPAETLETYGDLIEAFCKSKAFAGGAFWLLRALEKSVGRLPGMTCLVCERSLDGPSGDTFEVAKLIFRTYQQHQHGKWASRSLDLIDNLCLRGYPGVGSEFEQFDR